MCRVTMCQTFVHRVTSESPQKRSGVFSLEHYLASRTLLWAGHVARMPKNRLPKRLMLSFLWPKTDSIHVRYLALLMLDGYKETDWPMQYPQSAAIAWAWFEWLIRRSSHI